MERRHGREPGGAMTATLEKVTALVTREGRTGRELLVFSHPAVEPFESRPTIQVPAGTVEPGEAPRDAAIRELAEETGVSDARLIAEVGRVRHHFGLAAPVEIEGRHFGRGVVSGRVIESDGRRARVEIGGLTGWVPARAVARDVPRYLFHLAAAAGVPDAWRSTCDCGRSLDCYWVPLDAATELHEDQSHWLAVARERLLAWPGDEVSA